MHSKKPTGKRKLTPKDVAFGMALLLLAAATTALIVYLWTT